MGEGQGKMKRHPVEMQLGGMRTHSVDGVALKSPLFKVTIPLQGAPLVWWLPSPMCQGARKLLEAGFAGDRLLHVTRDGVPLFERDSTIAQWAGVTAMDSHETVRLRRYAPYKGPKDDE